ncbi:hypothetical protein NQ318_019545 [Aromia moschata]|uniref:Uncharacterized protein n=1 Tax=Aromia moschata TaxID=1265417 RepID=A0AAV8XAW3_9CUCU|nr:hypothetical protein NQ318_019545 [Aromia moschata]
MPTIPGLKRRMLNSPNHLVSFQEEVNDVKREIKNEVKSEIKVEDDVKTVDNPLAKLTPLMPLKDSKEDKFESLMIG